jgi:MSHA pilin protein MshB
MYLTTPPAGSATVRQGYPMSNDGSGSEAAAGMNDARCEQVWNGIFSQPANVSNSIADVNDPTDNVQYYVDVISGAGNNSNDICAYYLKESLNKDVSGDYVAPGGVTTVGNLFTYDPSNSSVVVYVNN